MNEETIKKDDGATPAELKPAVFVVSRYLEENGKTYMGNYGPGFDTQEAAEKHLEFVKKTVGFNGMIGVTTVNKPFLFEVRKLEVLS